MAGLKPFFLTGANAIIRVNGVAIAFATNISYSVRVNHVSPRVLGRYEVEEHQPLSYDVSGSFSIIRYANGLKKELEEGNSNKAPEGVSYGGNGIGTWGPEVGNSGQELLGLPGTSTVGNGNTGDSFTPSALNRSQMFDLQINQQLSGSDECTYALIRNCRIISSDFSMGKKSTANQSFTFLAQAVDEDSFTARKSGVGQELV